MLLLLACICMPATADTTAKKVTLKGRVTDAVDGKAVIGASIYFPQLTQGTVTNQDGEYVINGLPAIKTTIQVSYVGHQTIIESIDLRVVAERNFTIQENNAMLSEVVVTGLTGSARADQSPAPVSVVSPRELQAVSSTNIIDAVAHQPGDRKSVV